MKTQVVLRRLILVPCVSIATAIPVPAGIVVDGPGMMEGETDPEGPPMNPEPAPIPTPPAGRGPVPLGVAQSAAFLMTGGMFEDVNGRLFRNRAGIRDGEVSAIAGSWSAPGPKGGMAKEVLPPVSAQRQRWEVFGSVGFFQGKFDGVGAPPTPTPPGTPPVIPPLNRAVPGVPPAATPVPPVANQPFLPGYDLNLFHGTIGIEYDFPENYSIGAALLAASGEIDSVVPALDMDVESLGAVAYGTYFREDALKDVGVPISGDYWADLLYAFQTTDFELSSGGGTSEADTHRVEFNTGVLFQEGRVTHGPMGGVVWADGEVDPSGGGAGAEIKSVATRVGYQASFRVPTSVGEMIPQVRAAWEHEFETDPVLVGGLNIGEPDSDKAVLGAGVLWQFHENFYAALSYEARLGSSANSHNVVLRVGGAF